MKSKLLPSIALALVGSCLAGCHFWTSVGTFGLGSALGDTLSAGLIETPGPADAPDAPPVIVVVRSHSDGGDAGGRPGAACEGHPGHQVPAWCR